MGLAATVFVMAMVVGADAPFGERTGPGNVYGTPGQPETPGSRMERVRPDGVFDKPIKRYVQVLYDFMAPPPLTPMTPGMPPLPPGAEAFPPVTPEAAVVPPAAPVVPPAPPLPSPPPVATEAAIPGLPPPPELPMAPVQLATGPAQVGGETRLALCLHPEGIVPATVTFPWVWIRPVAGEWPRIFLVFRVGLADPLVEPDLDIEPALSTLTVTMGGRMVFSEEVRERKWTLRAVDVTDLGGQMGDVVFRASTLNTEEKRAVICVAEPRLIEEQGIYFLSPAGRELNFGFSLGRFPRGQQGLALAQVRAASDSTVELTLGDTTAQFKVMPGTQWLPLEFERAGRFSFRPVEGDAELLRLDVAPIEPVALTEEGQEQSPAVAAPPGA